MTHSRFCRTATAFALTVVFAMTSFAAEPAKRRAVKPGGTAGGGGAVSPPTTEFILTGTVIDAVTSAPLRDVRVNAIGKSGLTDANGIFRIRLPLGATVQLHLSRLGYETTTTNATLTGDVSMTFRLTAKPTIRVRTTSGTIFEVDTETVEFGYVAPFSGYVKGTTLKLCGASGATQIIEAADIRSIKTGVSFTSPSCCAGASVPAVDVALKNGSTTTGSFIDACDGYKVDIIGQDHKTAQPLYIHFSDIAEVTFP